MNTIAHLFHGLGRALIALLLLPFTALGATKATTYDAAQYVTESRDPYMWEKVFRRVTPNRAPYMTLLANREKRKVTSHRFYHFSEKVVGHRTRLTGTINNSTTTIGVADTTLFIVDYAFIIPSTGEIFLVTALPGGGNLTVATRPFGGTATAVTFTNATDPAMEVWVLGHVAKEGSDAPASHFRETENDYNLIGEHRKAWKMTTLAMDTSDLRGPEEFGRRAKIEMTRFKEEQERFAFFGKRAQNTVGSDIYRTTGGLIEWVEAFSAETGEADRVRNLNGSMPTAEVWEEVARDAFEALDGSVSTLTAFVGPRVITALNQARLPLVRMDSGKTFGIHTAAYETNHGRINFVLNRQFAGYYAGYGVIVPVAQTRKAVMSGPIEHERNIQTPGQKSRQDGYYQAWGLDRPLKNHLYLVKGIGTGPVGA